MHISIAAEKNYCSENTPKVTFKMLPRIFIFLSRCLCRAGCDRGTPLALYIAGAPPPPPASPKERSL